MRGVGGLGSGAASRELLCSSRSPTTPPSQRAMRSLKTSSSGKVKVGAGSEGQMGRGLEHPLVLPLLLLSLPQPNSRHEVEEQVLGQIPGDCACWDSQREPAQVSVPKCWAAGPSPQAIPQAGMGRHPEAARRGAVSMHFTPVFTAVVSKERGKSWSWKGLSRPSDQEAFTVFNHDSQ